MKCVILAGGLGTRLAEETVRIPKPMVEIGGRPILWHIMKIYGAHGVTDFIICCSYRGYAIKEYFTNYFLHMSDVTFDMADGSMEILRNQSEPWRVTLIDTGQDTMTGGRIGRVLPLLNDDEAFHLTYGDGVGNVDITALTAFHKAHGKLATVTAVPPPRRFGQLQIEGNAVTDFLEKPVGDETIWERAPLQGLANDGQLQAFEHQGFWQPMDTLRERQELEEHWESGQAPWKVWE